jgi:hypothetical protein
MSIDANTVYFKQLFAAHQTQKLVAVGVMMLFWWLFIESYWPDFFSPGEWTDKSTESTFTSVTRFWPVFIWGGFWAILSAVNISWLRLDSAEEHLFWDMATSTLAGVWEELGYRCIYILTAMIGIVFLNFFWGWFFTIVAVGCVIFMIYVIAQTGTFIEFLICAIGFLLSMGLLILAWKIDDPVYWMYQSIIFPFFGWASFGLLDPILYYEHAPWLFIAGAISANAKFRDGHKYQGLFGLCNAWAVGFMLLYAMLYYGLWVAIIVHVVYDILFAVAGYLGRKFLA